MSIRTNKTNAAIDIHQLRHFLAERTGFEPVKRFGRLHAFQACLFNHSSIFPCFGFQKQVQKYLFFVRNVHLHIGFNIF